MVRKVFKSLTMWKVEEIASWQNGSLSKWQVDKMVSKQNGKLMHWQAYKIPSWKNTKFIKYLVDQMPGLQNGKLTKCQVYKTLADKMPGLQNGKLTKCQVYKTLSWPNGKLTHWQLAQWPSTQKDLHINVRWFYKIEPLINCFIFAFYQKPREVRDRREMQPEVKGESDEGPRIRKLQNDIWISWHLDWHKPG